MNKPTSSSAGRALILGVTGQDGAYLARRLLEDDYEVTGTSRSSSPDLSGLRYLGVESKISVRPLDPISVSALTRLLSELRPDEIYNLSGQSSVGLSFSQPDKTFQSIASAHRSLLEVVYDNHLGCRVFNAGSGECFGSVEFGGRSKVGDAFNPLSPYAVAKVAATRVTEYFRETHAML